MKTRKLTTVAAIFLGISLPFVSVGAAAAAPNAAAAPAATAAASNGDPRFNGPIPTRCYPEYMTAPGDCFPI